MENAHAGYINEEALKKIEQQENQIRNLNEILKAAKKSANESSKVEAKRSYSIHSKGAHSSNAKFTVRTLSSNGSVRSEEDENYNTSSVYLNLHSPNRLREIENDPDELNKLRRLVAHYRGNFKRLDISFKDYKSKTTKELS